MKNKRDKRIDGLFDYLIFHDIRGEAAIDLLIEQNWIESLFNKDQILEIEQAFVLDDLTPECISVIAYPQYSARLMKNCREYLSWTYIDPNLIEALCIDFKDLDRIKDICEAIYDFGMQYIQDVPFSKEQTIDFRALAKAVSDYPNFKFLLSDAAWESELQCIDLWNYFSESDELYARVEIEEEANHKILCECIISIPSNGLNSIPWDKQLSLLAKARMNVEELLNLPKLNECSELLQLLIRYQLESEAGMFFVDEGDDEDEPLYSLENRIALDEEVEELGLQELIEVGLEELNSDDCLITVYSSACTAFNLIGSKL